MNAQPKLSAPDLVRDGLRRSIMDGDIPGGAQLRQDELAERFGTSRIPVREALRQLEAEGLVTIHPNRGAVVASLSLEEVLELLDIRVALECRALSLAIPEMVDSDFEDAQEILNSYDLEPEPSRWSEMNRKFHETLYAPCHRPRLLAMIEANYGQIGRFLRVQVSRVTGKEQPQTEHRKILLACRARKRAEAVALLEQHILNTQRLVRASMRRSGR